MTMFSPLLRVQGAHDYFGDAVPPIAMEADFDTLRVVAGANLRLRAIPGRVDIFADENRTLLRNWSKEGKVPMVFRLRASDQTLPMVTAGLGETRNTMFMLDEDHEKPLTRGEAIPLEALKDVKPLGTEGLVATSDMLNPPMAMLRVDLDPEARDVVRTVRFQSVARHWMYYVVGGPADAKYAIRDTEGSVDFIPLGDYILSNGAAAKRFRSSVPIEMRARPSARFELISNGPFGERVVLPVLPAAAPGASSPDQGTGGFTSDIYVNVT